MVAAINNGGGFYRPEIYSRSQNEWRNDHNRVSTKAFIRLHRGWNGCVFGFYFKESKSEYIFNIVAEREKMVHSKSIENFITRVPSGLESIQTLIFIGAFRCIGKTKFN
jgi:DNA polymerase III alpha subunit